MKPETHLTAAAVELAGAITDVIENVVADTLKPYLERMAASDKAVESLVERVAEVEVKVENTQGRGPTG